jgi:phage tail P2-like protein
MSYPSILPPASTPLEKALEQVAARLVDMPTPIRTVWSPADCPVGHLPWLAWGLAISHWKTVWSVEYKRAAIADAIPYHRRKGTRSAVEEVLARYHPAFRIVEWHQANPMREPHTFEVRAPASEILPSFLTIALAEEIVADVAVAKPARSHFDFVQTLEAEGTLYLAAGGVTGSMFRADFAATLDASRDWNAVWQTEQGEPIRTEDGLDYLESS